MQENTVGFIFLWLKYSIITVTLRGHIRVALSQDNEDPVGLIHLFFLMLCSHRKLIITHFD